MFNIISRRIVSWQDKGKEIRQSLVWQVLV
jgi:hypothetical protein